MGNGKGAAMTAGQGNLSCSRASPPTLGKQTGAHGSNSSVTAPTKALEKTPKITKGGSMSHLLSRFKHLGMCLGVSVSLLTPPTFAAPPKIDPCSLLTTAEVEQAVGSLKSKPTGDREGDAAWCN